MMKEQLKETITALADAFQQKDDQKNAAWLQLILTEYAHYDLEDPEKFSLLVSITTDRQIDLLARTVLAGSKLEDQQKQHKLEMVYKEYGFIERHLKSIILAYEGHGCSTDKTRWLLRNYCTYLKTDTIPTIETRSYVHSKYGTPAQWFDYIDAIIHLYYGKEQAYMETKGVLIEEAKKGIQAILEECHYHYQAHPHFDGQVQAEKEGDYCYTFKDAATNDKGTIFISDKAEKSYRFYSHQEERYLSYQDRELIPTWFTELLK